MEISDGQVKIVEGFSASPQPDSDLASRLSGVRERLRQPGGNLAISTKSGVAVRATVPAKRS